MFGKIFVLSTLSSRRVALPIGRACLKLVRVVAFVVLHVDYRKIVDRVQYGFVLCVEVWRFCLPVNEVC